jgi:hypothetical protein
MARYRVTYQFNDCRSVKTNMEYQRYLLWGFRLVPEVELCIKPTALRIPVSLDFMGFKRTGVNIFWRVFGNRSFRGVADHVGRYAITDKLTGIKRRVAVDAADGWMVMDEEAYDWSDLYFKNNYWPSMEYPRKVRPFVNGDGWLSPKLHGYLKSLRTLPKTTDLYYWTRIWEPGVNAYFTEERCRNVVEYQVRLYETLSKLKCNKSFGVVLPPDGLKSFATGEVMKRLLGVGVRCGTRRMSYKEFWTNQSSSRIVFARPGDHLCVSFRICGFLMTGSCIVYDGEPFVQWYERLVPGLHYVHGGCRMGRDYSLPTESMYDGIVDAIETLLSNTEQMDVLRQNAAQYFDEFVSPEGIARHILSACSTIP